MDPQLPPAAVSPPPIIAPQQQPRPSVHQQQQQQHQYHPQQRQEQHHYQQHHNSDYDAGSTYNEKDAYPRPTDPRSQRGSKGSNGRSHDSVISHPFSPKPSSPPSPSSSISSAHYKHRSIEAVQQSDVLGVPVAYPARAHIDPEKAAFAIPPQDRRTSNRANSNPDVPAALYDSGEYNEKGPEEKPVQLLLYLSAPCVLLSFAITIWTLFALLIALLLQPLRFFSTRPSLSSQLTTFLAPPLNLQLHLIYSCTSSTTYSPAMLVVVHLFSPVVAVGVAIAAWTAACFWFFSVILGDPGGHDGPNDGKENILGVRNWWDRWLSRALR